MSHEESPHTDFAIQVGNFFLLLGALLFLLFAWSDQVAQNAVAASRNLPYKMLNKTVVKAPNFDYFFTSIISIVIGVYLRRKAVPPPPAERFSSAKKFFGKKEKK